MSQSLKVTSNPSSESGSTVLNFFELLGWNQVNYRGLSIAERDTNTYTILFTSTLAAREAAYMLRGSWDGANAVTIFQPDPIAIRNAVELVKLESREEVEFCRNGEFCYLPEEVKKLSVVKNRKLDLRALKISALLMQGLDGEIKTVTLEFPR